MRTEEDPAPLPPLVERADPAAVAAAAPAMFCRVRDDVWLTRRSPVAASLDIDWVSQWVSSTWSVPTFH